MANDQAWQIGAAIGSKRADERRAHKQALSDQEFEQKANLHAQELQSNREKLSSLDPTKDAKEYADTQNALRQNLTDIRDLYHPERHPNAVSRFGHIVTDALKLTNPQQRIQAEAQKREAGIQGDEKLAQGVTASLPFTPERQALQGVQTDASTKLASFNAAVKNFQAMNPDATPEQIQSFRNDQIQKMYGSTVSGSWKNVSGKLNGQPASLLFDAKTGKYRLPNRESVPEEMMSTWVADTNVNESTRADYAKFLETNTDYEKKGGTFESWKAEQAGIGRNRASAAKPETFDKQYQTILVKEQSGQPLTPDEQAHKLAWHMWNKERFVDPGVARMVASGANRYIMVYNPADPENVIPMRAADAAKSGARSPQSIAFQTDKAITRYMVAGQGGVNINYFNTATDHLEILRQAGEALNNGDYPLFNKYANSFATATGAPAPTNFDAVKSAVSGELSKTFKGTGATDQEIAEINQTINNAQSPQQIQGAIEYYTKLMGSKLGALKGQYDSGKSGRPNFPGGAPTPQGGGSSLPPAARARLKEGLVTTFGNGQKWTLKNGQPEQVQ